MDLHKAWRMHGDQRKSMLAFTVYRCLHGSQSASSLKIAVYMVQISSYTNTISIMFSHLYRIHYLMASKVLRNLKAIYLADSYCIKQSE